MSIPNTQKAAVKIGSGETSTTEIQHIPVPKPGPHDIVVKITYSGLCSSDNALVHDGWAFTGVSMQPSTHGIAGHEGAGVVVAVGSEVQGRWKVGERAGVKWVASVCGQCEFCTNGVDECHCQNQLNSGVTAAGTFQEYCCTDGRYATKLPEGVSDEEAAPIMCGGLTAYVGCKKSNVRPGQWIVITGAGGGLGHMAVQYAKAMGMRVIAIDGGEAKREFCLKLGAEEFIDYTKTKDIPAEVNRITTYGAHGVVVTSATKGGYDIAPQVLRVRGTLVCLGLPEDPDAFAGALPMTMVFKELNVVGSLVGTHKEVEEALDFTVRDLVHPVLTIGELEHLDEYFEDMKAGKIVGRVCLKIAA